MSNRDFSAPDRPDPQWDGRPGGASPSRRDGFSPRSRAADSGYSRASGSGGGRGVGELDGYGRGSSGRSGSRDGGGRDGSYAPGRSSRAGGGEPSPGLGGNGYQPRRAAPGGGADSGRGPGHRAGGRSSGRPGASRSGPGRSGSGQSGSGQGGDWDDRGGRSAGRGGGRYGREDGGGTGVRDIRDDLRARLRRNGIGDGAGARADWEQDGRPGRRLGRGASSFEETDGGGGLRRRGRKGRGGDGDGGDWDGPDGKGPKRKGSWWRHWSWKKALGVVAAIIGGFMVAGAATVAYAYSTTKIPPIMSAVQQQESKVYFSDGKTLVGSFGQTNRTTLNFNQIPPVLVNAVVAAEDKNYWHEGGISVSGIIRAAYYDLTTSGSSLQGGSTITQQLVRNYYAGIGTAQTISRKVDEIFIAEKLAQQRSKQWILQQYLNTIYLGDGAYGVGSAAQVYFGLDTAHLSKITPAQAAMIAAMIQQPGVYSPNPKAGAGYTGLVYRWKYVLLAMRNMNTLSAADYAQALKKFPTTVPPPSNSWSGYKGYIMAAVERELQSTYHYSTTTIDNGGLKIVTTFSEKLMKSLNASVRTNERYMKRCTPPPALSFAPTVACSHLPSYVHVGAVLEQPGTGAILAMYSGPGYTKHCKTCQFDMALQSRNQVGSSFKPYVLATAVQQGMNVQNSTLNGNSPLWIPPDTSPFTYAKQGTGAPNEQSPFPGGYEVTNDESGGNSLGPVKPQEATAASLNTAFTDLWHRVAYSNGQHNVTNMAKAFGVDVVASSLQKQQDQAGIALGQASLTVEEQATTIATLANGGVYATPHVIQSITNGSQVIPAKITHRTVLTPAQAADVDWAMSQDTVPGGGGTAAGLGLTNGQEVIAKTGTTNLAQSGFFMGATPRYAMAVGMFVDQPSCPPKLTAQCAAAGSLAYQPPAGLQTLFGVGAMPGYGGDYPASIWHTFFMANFNRLPLEPFPPVNNDGAVWNLMGPGSTLAKPKPHHQQNQGGGQGGQGCPGQGPPFGHCHHSPPPSPPPSPTPTPSPTATGQPTGFPQANTRAEVPGGGGTSGGGSGALALAAVVIIGPALSVTGRLRDRRRRSKRVH